MRYFLVTRAFLLSISLSVLYAAEASKVPAAKKADQRLQAA
ncbi:MAG TPA: hypothetical protein PLF81_02830 [Candidatus Anammoximicrobium sp.]|nr:hypothetical protein [Candidatus Anammoximicrobium sp.]